MKSNKIMASFEFDSERLSDMYQKSVSCLEEIKNMTQSTSIPSSRLSLSSVSKNENYEEQAKERKNIIDQVKAMVKSSEKSMYNNIMSIHGSEVEVLPISSYIG